MSTSTPEAIDCAARSIMESGADSTLFLRGGAVVEGKISKVTDTYAVLHRWTYGNEPEVKSETTVLLREVIAISRSYELRPAPPLPNVSQLSY